MAPLKFEFADNQTVAVLTIEPDTQQLRFSATDIEQLIHRLGVMRSAMLPAPEDNYEFGKASFCVTDPRWATESELLQGNSLLHLRDTRFGWLHYSFPRHEAAALAGFLKSQSEAPDPVADQTRN